IAPTFILRQGDTGGRGAKVLHQFPSTVAELRAYDVVIIGDLAADFFSGDEMKALDEFVRKEGGGLIAIAGRNHFPAGYQGTPIAAMLPVEIDAQPAPSAGDDLARSLKTGYRPLLTPEGERWPALRFDPDAGKNEQDWRNA